MIRAMVTVETKPVWNSSSFLIYEGGLTVLQGATVAIVYLAMQFHGAGERTADAGRSLAAAGRPASLCQWPVRIR